MREFSITFALVRKEGSDIMWKEKKKEKKKERKKRKERKKKEGNKENQLRDVSSVSNDIL